MSRTKSATVLVSELPAYLRSEHDANLVALALEAEAVKTREAANVEGLSEPAAIAIRAQAVAYENAAAETRITAKWIAQGRTGGSTKPQLATSNLVGEAVEDER